MASLTFSGNFVHTIDPKGRATIPICYRELLGQGFTIGLSQQFNALALYPKHTWDEIEEGFRRVPAVDEMGMRYVHLINDNAFKDCDLDGQGRVLLPSALRQLVGLEKSIRFVGAVTNLEIWDEARYVKYTQESLGIASTVIQHFSATYFKKEP